MKSADELKALSKELRKDLLIKHNESKIAHIGSDLSCLDILIALHFEIMGDDDRFVLSKGHSALALYSVLHKKRIIDDNTYDSLGKDGSRLGEHPLYGTEGIEIATGSLGHGLSVAAGIALSKERNKEKGKVYVLLSDGECQEGSTLEAMNFVGINKIKSLIAIVDSNKWQAFDRTLLGEERIKEEFAAAGWNVVEIDGHDYESIIRVFEAKNEGPLLIVAHTVLGKGVKSMEDRLESHYRPPTKEQIEEFDEEL